MRLFLGPALLAVGLSVGGCAYVPVAPDPIRYVTSPVELTGCRRLGPVGYSRTDGVGSYSYGYLRDPIIPAPAPPAYRVHVPRGEIMSPNFAVSIETMRDSTLLLGGSDLLLTRRFYRDWSYVAGTAYRCRR